MKQVLLVATVGGFVPQFELNNVKLLKDAGCNVHYAANFNYSVYSVSDKMLNENKIVKHQLDIPKSPFKLLTNYRAYKSLKKLIDENNIRLVHCHTPVGGLLARVAAVRSKKKPKVIYTAHGFHFYKGAPFFYWCTYYLVERLLARHTDALITINEEDYRHALKFRMRKGGKVYKIPGVGLDLKRFAKFASDGDNGAEKNSNQIKLVTVAELNKNKNHQSVIKAIAKLGRDDIYYDIYGDGPYRKYLKTLIKELHMEKYVKLKGYTNEPEKVLKEADCFVFPSIREGLGMAALEAMSLGVPVIAKDNRGTREYMKEGYNGFICFSGNPLEYARVIAKISESKEMREAMGRNAIITAEKFDIKHTEETMRLVYNTLV